MKRKPDGKSEFELVTCRITKIEFPGTTDPDLPEQAEQVVGSGFSRQIRHQRSRKPPGTKNQLEI